MSVSFDGLCLRGVVTVINYNKHAGDELCCRLLRRVLLVHGVQSSLADLLRKMVIGNHLYWFVCVILVSCHQTFGSNKEL